MPQIEAVETQIWTPNSAPQLRALEIEIDELLFGGSKGGGKTDAGIVWVAVPACGPVSYPRFRGLVLRKNWVDLCDWIDRAKRFYIPTGARFTEGEFRWPHGPVIRTGHLDSPDAYEKYWGHEYQRILIEELTHLPSEELLDKILLSCRSTVPGLRPQFMATTNPGGPGHGWVKARYIDPAPPGKAFGTSKGVWRIFIPAKLSDNPALANDAQYLAKLESLPDHLRRAWLDGDWNALAGQYFPEFDSKIHIVKPFRIPDHWEIGCGLDWGYSRDPWAAPWFAVDEHGEVVLWREQTGIRQIPSEVAGAMTLEGTRWPSEIVADPSMWGKRDGDSTALKFMDALPPSTSLLKGDNGRLQGWMRIHEYLRINPRTGRPWLRIFSTCTESIRCLTSLIHSDRDPEDAADDPAIDHFPDAIRYFLMSRPLPADPAPRQMPKLDPRSMAAVKHRRDLAARLKPTRPD